MASASYEAGLYDDPLPTPFEDVDMSFDADLPLPSIEHDAILCPPSPSSERYTASNSHSSLFKSPRRLSDEHGSALTAPSSISELPLTEDEEAVSPKKKTFVAPSELAGAKASTTSSFSQLPPTKQQHRSAFRNPSSVRALQLAPTTSASSSISPSHHHHDYSTSTIKMRRHHRPKLPPSANSSPALRHHQHSTTTTPSPSKQHPQHPLILLHATLLPPSSSLPFPPSIMSAVLPPRTMRAFRLLEDRVYGDSVLMSRGLLLAHPRDEYELLEERLLEGLGLEEGRVLKCGHFRGAVDPSSCSEDDEDEEEEDYAAQEERMREEEEEEEEEGFDDVLGLGCFEPAPASSKRRQQRRKDSLGVDGDGGSEFEDDDEDEDAEQVCEDCHSPIKRAASRAGRGARPRWDVKVYAANGLMRAGAWGAAWSEMERVDVEIAPWISERQRRAMERAVAAEEAAQRRREREEDDARKREVEAAREAARREAETVAEQRAREAARRAEEEKLRLIGNAALAAAAERRMAEERVKDAVKEEKRRQREEAARRRAERAAARSRIPLGTLLKNYILVLATDRRNILIALLAVLVAFLSVQQQQTAWSSAPPTELEILNFELAPAYNDNNDTATILPQLDVVQHTTTVTAFILETIAPAPTAKGDQHAAESVAREQLLQTAAAADGEAAAADVVVDDQPATAQPTPETPASYSSHGAAAAAGQHAAKEAEIITAQTDRSRTHEDGGAAQQQAEASSSSVGAGGVSPDAEEGEADRDQLANPHAALGLKSQEADAALDDEQEPVPAASLSAAAVEEQHHIAPPPPPPAGTASPPQRDMDDPEQQQQEAPFERRVSEASASSMDIPIRLDRTAEADETGERTTFETSTAKQPFEEAHAVLAARETEEVVFAMDAFAAAEEEQDYPMSDAESTSTVTQDEFYDCAEEQETWCAAFDPAERVFADAREDATCDEGSAMDADDAAEAFMEAVVLEESNGEDDSVSSGTCQNEMAPQRIIVEPADGCAVSGKMPDEVQSPVAQSEDEEKLVDGKEEIGIVLDV